MKSEKLHIKKFITNSLLFFTGSALATSYNGRTELTSEQLRYAATGVQGSEFSFGTIIVPIICGLLLTAVFFAVKYLLTIPSKKKGESLLEDYKKLLESMALESDFSNRRRKYYIWRINKFKENGQWISMKTGLHEDISPSLVEDFISYHNKKIKNIDSDEVIYHAELKKIKIKDFIKFREIFEEMESKILDNDYHGYKNKFSELISYGKSFRETKLNKIEIDANVEDLSKRFYYTEKIHKILKDSESFYSDGIADLYIKKIFNEKIN